KQRTIFVEGARNNNVPDEQSGGIFDLMEKFAAYGFNKSHSAAYALVSFHTLWLKAHYPAEFMAAVLSADMHNTDKVVTLIEECRNMRLRIMSPDVNYSEFKFTVDENGRVIYGLGAIKGLGEGPIESIVEARQQGGPFKDLFEFCRRVDMSRINRRSMDALIRSGAMDALGRRAVLMANVEEAIKAAGQHSKNQSAGMLDLFGDVTEAPVETPSLVQVPDWSDDERLNGERDTLGLYLTGHPIDQFEQELSHFTSSKIVDLKPTDRGNKTVIAGLVVAMRTMNSKRGGKMAFLTLDDRSGRVEVSVFGEVYEQNKAALEKDGVVVVEGEASIDDFSGNMKMVARRLLSINDAREQFAKTLTLNVTADQVSTDWLTKLQHILQPHAKGQCRVKIEYNRGDAMGMLHLGEAWRVAAKPELLSQLQTICGAKNVHVMYR
ncbi:MAG TPA: OB-fold nucleic acid binding domain-containing protein, partial [Pseudomonadales bacterium]|nr:OB-fold nucleic acid binding domain-containing protein [Pseudomonadales bacterium]